ncbi:hypothetical protein [Streptomyces sp. NPDC057428]|uniref:hypothetical protein n=1 Tax=Streptomyces sp. NPDC057428 TaxID=3346129 RepID=UPI00367F7C2E
MPLHAIPEKAALPHIATAGCTVPVHILEDDGTTARVQIEGCGIHLRQGQIHTVASDAIEPIRR